MRVVVTGGAGFIGSHTVELLVRGDHQVLVLDNLSEGNLDNLARVHARITLAVLDIRDRDACIETLAGWKPDAVVHLAAVASVVRSITEPAYVHEVNLDGTFNMLEAARLAETRRFVFASSAAVYGPEPALPSAETDAVDPVSPYAAQKAAGELVGRVYRSTWGLETVSLRFFNVFGPRQRPDSPYSGVISTFASELRNRGRASITGDGEQTRDFIYVADVARTLAAAATGADPGPGPINVAGGESLTIRRLYSLLAERLGVPDEPAFLPPRAGDVRHSLARVERLARGLRVHAQTPLEQGLDLLLRWFSDADPERPAAVGPQS